MFVLAVSHFPLPWFPAHSILSCYGISTVVALDLGNKMGCDQHTHTPQSRIYVLKQLLHIPCEADLGEEGGS